MYKHPDTEEFRKAIDPILKAGGLTTIGNDCIESVDTRNGMLYITTSWSCRGCSNSSDIRLPLHLLDATDPIKAATIWGLKGKIEGARQKMAEHQGQANWYQKQMNDLQAQLASMQ